ncbi:hypothetical protein BE08_06105 [Sorangium cellulosum]|uniref:Secreted protein n=1 Tax=Sorangium cellulosum TaxID=56 RepID=A0A150P151_SORCE|nr:hypothetical protein BE08_06105 [Sorangium cellulosum]
MKNIPKIAAYLSLSASLSLASACVAERMESDDAAGEATSEVAQASPGVADDLSHEACASEVDEDVAESSAEQYYPHYPPRPEPWECRRYEWCLRRHGYRYCSRVFPPHVVRYCYGFPGWLRR